MDTPDIPASDYGKKLSKGELPPLESLPDRQWLTARIIEVKYKYAIFNNKIQMVTDMEGNEVLDEDGQPIPRREFEIVFEFSDYKLPNKKPRKAWLRLGASLHEKANLPVFLNNVCPMTPFETPSGIIQALKGKHVSLQLKNKANKKDPSKPPYQNVIFDAVVPVGQEKNPPPDQSYREQDLEEEIPDGGESF